MKMPYELQLEKRKTFNIFGPDDRSKFFYQGDAYNFYNGMGETRFSSEVFFRELEPLDNVLSYDDFKLEKSEMLNFEKISKALSSIYYNDNRFLDKGHQKLILLNYKKQIKISKFLGSLSSDMTVCEFGAGNGLLAAILLSKKIKRLVIVESIIPIYVHLQLLLVNLSREMGFNFVGNADDETSSKKQVELVAGWQLADKFVKPDIYVGVNFFDQICSHDFQLYTNWMRKNMSPTSKVVAWGGFERAGLPPQYLFGFGGYLNDNVTEVLKKDFGCKLLEYSGDLVLSSFSNSKSEPVDNVVFFENKMVQKFWDKSTTAIVGDTNIDFIESHQIFFEKNKIRDIFTFSPTTQKIGILYNNKQIKSQSDLKKYNKLILFSYRCRGFLNNPKIKGSFEAQKVSERVMLLTRKKR